MTLKAMVSATCVGVVSLFCISGAFQSSSESVNPFNQFMSPSGGVNLYSGNAAFSFPLGAIAGGVPVSLSYSSNVTVNARSSNAVAATGWCGLGWNLSFGAIACNHKGTATSLDDEYTWISPEGVPTRIVKPRKLRYKYYENDGVPWEILPNFSVLTPKATGYCDYFNVRLYDRDLNYGYVFEADLDLPYDGVYTFYLYSDDGSRIYIDNQPALSNDNIHPPCWQSGGFAGPLTKGIHTLRVEYFQGPGGHDLNVQYSHALIARSQLPVDRLCAPGAAADGRKRLYAENNPYVVFEPKDANSDGVYEGWTVLMPDGTRYLYGNQDLGEDRNATRNTFRSGNFVGYVTALPASKYPYQWDLARIKDAAGNTTDFWYQQEAKAVHSGTFMSENSAPPLYYTKASYIHRIESSSGGKAVFTVENKVAGGLSEPYDPFTFSGEPDGFMEIYESKRLASIDYYPPGASSIMARYALMYGALNTAAGEKFVKSLLTGVKEYRGGASDASLYQTTYFDYFDDYTQAASYENNYNYGALQSVRTTQGGINTYIYALHSEAVNGTFDQTFNVVGATCPNIRGDNGVVLHGGTYDNGKEYIVVQGGNIKDRIWLYTFDGHAWKQEDAFNCAAYGSVCKKDIYTFDNMIVYKDAGHQNGPVKLIFWSNNKWCVDDIAPNGDGVDNVYAGNDFLLLRGGSGDHQTDRIWLYRLYGDRWLLDKDYTNKDFGTDAEKYISVGNDFFVVKAAGNNYNAWIVQWDGFSWHEHRIPAYGDEHFTDCYAGPNYVVIIGGSGQNSIRDFIWIYYWNGSQWVYDPTYKCSWIFPGKNEDKTAICAAGYFIVKQTAETQDQVCVFTWNGEEWVQKMLDPVTGGDQIINAYAGPDYLVLTGGDVKVFDRLSLYRRTGNDWAVAPELNWAQILFTGQWDNFNVVPVANAFAVMTTGSDAGKLPKIYSRIYTYDGNSWSANFNADYENTGVDNSGVPKTSLCVTHSGFGFAWMRLHCIKTDCHAENVRLLFVHKYQDNYSQIRNYIVVNKSASSLDGSKPQSTNYEFVNNRFDAYVGVPKFGKASIITYKNGRQNQYFFNDIEVAGQTGWAELDGMVYKTESVNESGVVVANARTLYECYGRNHWPQDVFAKRPLGTLSEMQSVRSISQTSYNNDNGLPNKTSAANSNDRKKVAGTVFAFEKGEYATVMGPGGANMLTQPCRSFVYEKDIGDANGPAPTEYRSGQAVVYRNNLGCATWMPYRTYAWNVIKDKNGVPLTGYVDFDESNPTANHWQLLNTIEKYNQYGQVLQTSNPLNVSQTTVYRNDIHQPIGSVADANFYEAGLFSGDYRVGTNPNYWDYANGWEKGSTNTCELVNTAAMVHYGQKVIHVINDFAAGRNNRIIPGKAYKMTAWVKVTAGTIDMAADFRYETAINWPATALTTAAVPGAVTATPISAEDCAGKWKLMRLDIPASVTSQLALEAGRVWYARAWVGNPGNPANEAYVDDIRFVPDKALATTTYYDAFWQQPVLSVDAKSNPGRKVVYDGFGRPIQWWKIDKKDPSIATLVQDKEYHIITDRMNPDPTKWYKIVAKKNPNFCIDISGPTWADGQNIHLWTYTGAVNQQWKFVPAGGGYYNIVSRGGATFGIDDPAGNVTNGTQLQIRTVSGDNQKWELFNAGSGYTEIAAKANGHAYIDLENGNTANGGKLQICVDGTNTLWRVERVIP